MAGGGRPGGARAIRDVRSRAEYEEWYPTFAATGLVAGTWPVEYGGAGLSAAEARLVEAELAPLNLGRLNPLGLNLAAPALLRTVAKHSGDGTYPRSSPTKRSGASSSASPVPVPTWPRCPRGASGTAMSGW